MAFRMTPEEYERVAKLAEMSGMNRQDFIMAKLMDHEIVVKPSTRVYKALKGTMAEIYQQLLRIRAGGELSASAEQSIELLSKYFAGLAPTENAVAEVDAENEDIWNMERW